MAADVWIKRLYDQASPEDGARLLVDRVWPRGVTKEAAALTLWLKEIAPSTALRQWFGHEPARFAEFRRRYLDEIRANAAALERLRPYLEGVAVVRLHRQQHHQPQGIVGVQRQAHRPTRAAAAFAPGSERGRGEGWRRAPWRGSRRMTDMLPPGLIAQITASTTALLCAGSWAA